MARKIIAASIGYTDPATSPTSNTLYVATESFTTDSGDTPANTFFDGRLQGNTTYGWKVGAPFTGYRPVTSFGAITIANHDGQYDDAENWTFRDGSVVIKALDPGQNWDAGTLLATAVADAAEISNLNELKIVLRDPAAILDKPLLSETYTLSNAPDAQGKLIPTTFGTPLNVEPVLTDESVHQYKLHDATVVDIDVVRDNGEEITAFSVTNRGFTLDAAPTGRVTADPVAAATGTIKVIDDAVEADGALLSNLDRTIQNPFRITDSPHLVDMSAYGEQSRLASAAGKYYFEVKVLQSGSYVTGAEFPDGDWGVQMGVGASQPTNPHRINNADEYSMWTVNASGAAGYKTYEDGSLIDGETGNGLGTWTDVVVGVLVNFDDMQVSFRLNGSATGSTLDITANSPLDTFYPLVAVAANNAPDVRSSDNKCSLFLHDEFFEEDIPAEYSSWAGSAYTATTGFEELVTSITDKISGLSVDSTSQTTIDDLGYSYSYYVKDGRSAAQVLFEGCASFNGWYYINRAGNLAFGRLVEPSGSGVVEFDDSDIIQIRKISPDYARGLSNRMGALKNWSRLNIDSADSNLSEDDRALLADAYRHQAVSSNTLAPGYEHADGAEQLPTYFRTAADADTEIDRLIALYGTKRQTVVAEVAFDVDNFTAIELGDVVTLTLNRYTFSSSGEDGSFSSGFSSGFDLGSGGAQFLVLGIEGNFTGSTMRLTLWG